MYCCETYRYNYEMYSESKALILRLQSSYSQLLYSIMLVWEKLKHLCISLPLPLYHPLRLPSQHTNNIRHQPGWRGDLPVHRREQCRLHTGQCTPHGALGWWAARFAHSRERWGPFTHHHPGVLEGARSEHSGHHRLCAPHPQDLRWGCSKDTISHMHVACTRDLDE